MFYADLFMPVYVCRLFNSAVKGSQGGGEDG